jgi:hypothetical protein
MTYMQIRTAVRAVDAEQPREQSQLAAWFLTSALVIVIWSVSYLVRQPGVATNAMPFSPVGDFALEGMLLALGWLAVLAAACIAVLTGAARIDEPR